MTGVQGRAPVIDIAKECTAASVIGTEAECSEFCVGTVGALNERPDSGEQRCLKPRCLYRRSTKQKDSVWIKRLNGVLPVEYDRATHVYIKYNQYVCGYEVTACWMPFDASNCETGRLFMNFHPISGGRDFQYVNTNKYTNPILMDITFDKESHGHRDGDVYYFDYVYPTDSVNNEDFPDSPLGYYTPFQFFDVDFDGEHELLVNNFGRSQQGNSYEVFDITSAGLCRKDYIPFSRIDNETEFFPAIRTIVLYAHDGTYDSSRSVFRRCRSQRPETLLVPDRLANATSGWLLKEYNARGETDFDLISIQQIFSSREQDCNQNRDSIYVYGVSDGELKLLQAKKKARYTGGFEIYNPISFPFRYKQRVQGYCVEGRLLLFDTPQGLGNQLEGACLLSFYNDSTGCRYDILSEHYCDENSTPGWYDESGEYIFNPEVRGAEGILLFDYEAGQEAPFLFEDVDFDGMAEILIRRTSPLRHSVHYYEVYKLIGKRGFVMLTYPPFDGFYCDHCTWDEVSQEQNTITRSYRDEEIMFRFQRGTGISRFNFPYAVDTIKVAF
ncbi:hypothetical protein [uncultured Alistipes sp.]|uniref:hypothetical protein n=1 Tax=uncultured Alistipes sp. TaxID=538949 RepID=UPI00261E546F|nr:hypothetical protein [uncultured Alistipes sp.]